MQIRSFPISIYIDLDKQDGAIAGSQKSHGRVKYRAYQAEERAVDQAAGRTNERFSTADWQPFF